MWSICYGEVIAAKGFEKDTIFHMAAADVRGPSKLEGTVRKRAAYSQVHQELFL